MINFLNLKKQHFQTINLNFINLYSNKNLTLKKIYFYKINKKTNFSLNSYNKNWIKIKLLLKTLILTNDSKYFYKILKLQNNTQNITFKNTNIVHYLTYFQLQPIKSFKTFNIFFLRSQRRYNKRRYSKARLYSRSSFFGGCALSTIFVGNFWNASIKGADWNTFLIYNIDMNIFIFCIYLYLFYFSYRLVLLTYLKKKKKKIKIKNFLNKINIVQAIKNKFN